MNSPEPHKGANLLFTSFWSLAPGLLARQAEASPPTGARRFVMKENSPRLKYRHNSNNALGRKRFWIALASIPREQGEAVPRARAARNCSTTLPIFRRGIR